MNVRARDITVLKVGSLLGGDLIGAIEECFGVRKTQLKDRAIFLSIIFNELKILIGAGIDN